MPVVPAGLMICDTCGDRTVCAIGAVKGGMLTEKIPGWVVSQKAISRPGESSAAVACPKCSKAAQNGASEDPPYGVVQ